MEFTFLLFKFTFLCYPQHLLYTLYTHLWLYCVFQLSNIINKSINLAGKLMPFYHLLALWQRIAREERAKAGEHGHQGQLLEG
jgi:hypothetical protein